MTLSSQHSLTLSTLIIKLIRGNEREGLQRDGMKGLFFVSA
jgi:hypothetical protein